MTHNDDLPAEVRRQDQEAELQIAAQLSELRTGKGNDATDAGDLPAEVRRQDEEAELQIAAQLSELRTAKGKDATDAGDLGRSAKAGRGGRTADSRAAVRAPHGQGQRRD